MSKRNEPHTLEFMAAPFYKEFLHTFHPENHLRGDVPEYVCTRVCFLALKHFPSSFQKVAKNLVSGIRHVHLNPEFVPV